MWKLKLNLNGELKWTLPCLLEPILEPLDKKFMQKYEFLLKNAYFCTLILNIIIYVVHIEH